MKDSIVILNDGIFFPGKAVKMASLLADGFKKEICFLSFVSNELSSQQISLHHEQWLKDNGLQGRSEVKQLFLNQLHEVLAEMEASFLVVEIAADSEFRKIQPLLNVCKPLRIPYIFVTSATENIKLDKALASIGFLTEEKEKGIFASKLARFCNTSVTLLQARDYGSRAAMSVQQIQALFAKLEMQCAVEHAGKDSFKVQEEAATRASAGEADIVLITASREYGLDDIVFGPPERKIIARAKVPVMVINPRPDIYVLCD